MHVCMHVCVHVCVHACMHVRMCVRACACDGCIHDMVCIGLVSVQRNDKRMWVMSTNVYISVNPAVSAHSLAFPWRRT